MSESPSTIFISYSRTDGDFVDRLEADLQARGFITWVDRHRVEGGQDWADAIQQAIDRCDVMLVVLSPDSIASEWVKKEIGFAQNLGKTVIPLMYRQVNQVPIRLEGIQWVEFEGDYAPALSALLFALTAPVPPRPTHRAAPPLSIIETNEGENLDLVVAHPGPPPPDPNLLELYKAAVVARSDKDLERAATLFQRIVDIDATFQSGIAVSNLETLQADLRPIRIKKLREVALAATAGEDWRLAIGSWRALLGIESNNTEAQHGVLGALHSRAEKADRNGDWAEEIGVWEALLTMEPNNTEAQKRIPVIQQNQQWEWQYAIAQELVSEGKLAAAHDELDTLWSKAPYFGDPKHIASVVGVRVPLRFPEAEAERIRQTNLAEAERLRKAKLAAAEKARQTAVELERKTQLQRQAKLKAEEAAERARVAKIEAAAKNRLLDLK